MTVWHTTKTRYNDLNMNYTMSNVSADIILSLVIIRNSFTLAIPRAGDSRVSFQCTRPYLGQHFLSIFLAHSHLSLATFIREATCQARQKTTESFLGALLLFHTDAAKNGLLGQVVSSKQLFKVNFKKTSLERLENHFPLMIFGEFPLIRSPNFK